MAHPVTLLDGARRAAFDAWIAGMTIAEITEALDVSRPTVNRDWRFGRAFLAQKLGLELGEDELADAEGER